MQINSPHFTLHTSHFTLHTSHISYSLSLSLPSRFADTRTRQAKSWIDRVRVLRWMLLSPFKTPACCPGLPAVTPWGISPPLQRATASWLRHMGGLGPSNSMTLAIVYPGPLLRSSNIGLTLPVDAIAFPADYSLW